jgi:flagellar biosynthesis activator protein FlaF
VYANQLDAYRTVQKTTMSGRDIEASVLTQAALKLQVCQSNWGGEGNEEKLDEAIQYNQRVWSIFQGELAKDDNPLPKKLRQDILSLSLFIDKRIFDILSFPAPEKLTAIININLSLAAGLRGSPA